MYLINTENGEQWIQSAEELKDYVDPSIYAVIESLIEKTDLQKFSLEQQYDNLLSDYELLQGEKSDLEFDVLSLHNQNDDLEEKITFLEDKINTLDQEIEDLKNDLSYQA